MLPKVAVFLQDLNGGGAERMMLNLAGGIADSGVPVDLVLVRATGPYLESVPGNVSIVGLGTKRTSASIWALARYLRRERPAAVLAALTHVNIAAIIAAYLAGHRSRVVVSERSTMSKEAAEVTSPLVRLALRLAPWLYPHADGIVTVSRGAAADLAQFCRLEPQRVVVINNPVVGPSLARRAAEPLGHPWFAPDQPPVVLAVGRLSPEKEFETLIRAFAEVVKRRPARLIILGEGQQRPMLEALMMELDLSDKMALPGFAENPYSYMARAVVLVLSSRWEGSPNVLVEAMACGTPVVATDCQSGPAELLENGRLGPLVAVGDHIAMAAAIEQTLAAPVDRDALLRRAGMFSVAQAVQGYLREMLGEVSGKRQAT